MHTEVLFSNDQFQHKISNKQGFILILEKSVLFIFMSVCHGGSHKLFCLTRE
jgi:hypothetical protein